MIRTGDVVTTNFQGATGIKRRPCLVISSELYHSHHRDVILAVITTQLSTALTPTDYALQDWAETGLKAPSAVRFYLGTSLTTNVNHIGHLTERDWQEVQTG